MDVLVLFEKYRKIKAAEQSTPSEAPPKFQNMSNRRGQL